MAASVHMRGDHTLLEGQNERDSVFPRQPTRIQCTPTRLDSCVAYIHALHATCVRVHPILWTSTLRSLNPGPHSSPTLMHFLFTVYDNNLFHPAKRARATGRKAFALRASLHLLPWLTSETKSLSLGATVWFNPDWKDTGTKSLSYTTKQHCSLFSVTRHKEKQPFYRRLSIYPLPTDVDTVCCGLRCSLKTIVSLVSSRLLSFSSLLQLKPEIETGRKRWKTSGWQSALQGAFLPRETLPKSSIVGSSRQPARAVCWKYCVAR